MHQKSCKSAKNRQENFIHTLFCNLDPSEQTDFTENCTRGTSFAHARVFQQRFSFFAVTSVTHLLKNTDLFWKKRLLPTSTSPSIFHPLFFISTLQKQTNINKIPYSTIFQSITWTTVTLVTAKTQKLLFTCVCTRAREASRTHHFTFLNTICSLPILSHKNSISPNLLFHLFPMPSHPFSTFHKTTACFS